MVIKNSVPKSPNHCNNYDADIPDKVDGYWLQVSQQVSQRDEFITDELTNHLFQVTLPQTLPNFLQQK